MKSYTYYRLRIALKGQRERLFREIDFPYHASLDALAVTVISIFNEIKNESYEFRDAKRIYYLNLPERRNNTRVATYGTHLHQLTPQNNTFYMEYFTNLYTIEIVKIHKLFQKFKIPRVISGAGYGIATEGMNFLCAYLDGIPTRHKPHFRKSGKEVLLDFESFDLAACNRKLRQEYAKITEYYENHLW